MGTTTQARSNKSSRARNLTINGTSINSKTNNMARKTRRNKPGDIDKTNKVLRQSKSMASKDLGRKKIGATNLGKAARIESSFSYQHVQINLSVHFYSVGRTGLPSSLQRLMFGCPTTSCWES